MPEVPGAIGALSPEARRRLLEIRRQRAGAPSPAEAAEGADGRPEGGAEPAPRGDAVHHAFEALAARHPERPALTRAGRTTTYGALDRGADRLAARLRALGAGPERVAGVAVADPAAAVEAVLAVLKAGAAWRWFDPASLAASAGAPDGVALWVVDQGAGVPPGGAPVLRVDDGAEGGSHDGGDDGRVEGGAGADSLACVYRPAGGEGKGLLLEHRQLAALFAAADAEAGTAAPRERPLDEALRHCALPALWTLSRGGHLSDAASPRGAVQFSLFYFATDSDERSGRARYRLLLEGARLADRHGFAAVWTPERHFHAFGGLYPNPSVAGAAVAAVTERVGIRAGSVVLPLHNPVRVAEEWAVVDNLSDGRVGISFAPGWHARDFVLAPHAYAPRREVLFREIQTVRRLWAGEALPLPGPEGAEFSVHVHPRPVQPQLPVWVTAGGHPDAFRAAGEHGHNLLTHVLGHGFGELEGKIALYRQARRQAGHAGPGHVTVMLHTFLGTDLDEVRERVRRPLMRYLRESADLVSSLAGGGAGRVDLDALSPDDLDALLSRAFERYFSSNGLLGTPEGCLASVARLREIGCDEVACLIDFGVDADEVLHSLRHLVRLRDLADQAFRARAGEAEEDGAWGALEALSALVSGAGGERAEAALARLRACAAPVTLAVADAEGRPAAPGQEGEVCVAGPLVPRPARGAADRFDAGDGARLHRTGVRGWMEDGAVRTLAAAEVAS